MKSWTSTITYSVFDMGRECETEEEYKELIEERKEQLNKVEEMLDTEAEVSVNLIREDLVPEDVTPEQILPLLKILKE